MGARLSRRRLTAADAIWGTLLVGALAVFLVLGDPTEGVTQVPFLWHWATACLVVASVTVLFVGIAARLAKGPARAALFGTVAGILFGTTGALLKSVVANITEPSALFAQWELYVFAIGAALGQFFQNASYESGDLEQAFPSATALKPVVGALIGVTVLQEGLRAQGWELVAVGAGAALVLVATVMLARSSGRAVQRRA